MPIIELLLEDLISRPLVAVGKHLVRLVEFQIEQFSLDGQGRWAARSHYYQRIFKIYYIKNKQEYYSCFYPPMWPLQLMVLYQYSNLLQIIIMSQKINPDSHTFPPPPADRNYAFILSMNRNRLESESVSLKDVDQRIVFIMRKLAELNPSEQNEWREIQESKILNLARSVLEREGRYSYLQGNREGNRSKLRALKEHLRILVVICNRLKMEYDAKAIMDVIKKLYFNEYGEQIFPEFSKVGYSTHEFVVITSVEQSSFFNFCCCVEENLYM